jgi:hypothetical protein
MVATATVAIETLYVAMATDLFRRQSMVSIATVVMET